ncbi:hypothetical protein WICPIJ_006712 [Wickerhamomyces pijperi]|uniref:Uncharacterized protein n=1 Tax=Wickerhamomyces pijperi TaxID=599730 RepID=A0A9P8TKS4_WICPI|nr:hypothetical protein WICPIJ_006712 [Wickerhamomyces pijperi]
MNSSLSPPIVEGLLSYRINSKSSMSAAETPASLATKSNNCSLCLSMIVFTEWNSSAVSFGPSQQPPLEEEEEEDSGSSAAVATALVNPAIGNNWDSLLNSNLVLTSLSKWIANVGIFKIGLLTLINLATNFSCL